MLFSSRVLSLASLLSLLTSSALAAEVCTYAARGCDGLYGCCTNVEEGRCCAWFTGNSLGWSVGVSQVDATSAWTALFSVDLRCQNANASATAIGDGSICVSTPDTPEAVNFNSAKWTTSALQARSDEAHHNHACAEPDVVGFKTPDGKKHLIKVPEGHGQLEYISQLLEAEDYAALTSYEHVE
ncbi:hypothetical protein CC2G_012576 [Coprinopsis cinerea AmutBmut pab1-1]|nr:hypothetical protein CC2G_012576 [Coprinopsis cinerea AmutBmut pab1-1]